MDTASLSRECFGVHHVRVLSRPIARAYFMGDPEVANFFLLDRNRSFHCRGPHFRPSYRNQEGLSCWHTAVFCSARMFIRGHGFGACLQRAAGLPGDTNAGTLEFSNRAVAVGEGRQGLLRKAG